MSRDYKPRSSSASGKNGSSLFLGLLIGYGLGLLSAIGVWLYISQAPSPFISHDKAADSASAKPATMANNTGSNTLKGLPAAPGEGKTAKADDRPRFEFYKILPGNEETISEQQLKQAAQQPASPSSSSQSPYFLQAGSFQNADDAENLKAKLALLGVEASIQSAEVPEKGVWHRVRVGPFTKIDDLNRLRASLRENGIQTSLVKVREGAQ